MPFSPSDISGLKIWLKADAGAGSSDGDLISSWADQSGGSHNFTTSGSQRPTYRVGVRFGLPVVRFVTDDELSGGNLSSLFSTGASMFAAANWTGSTHSAEMTLYESGQIDAWWSFHGAGYWGPFRSSRLSNTPSSGLPSSGWHMWSLTADNGSNYKMWVDGVNQINDTAGFTFAGGTQHWLSRQHPGGDFTEMDMGELIVYDSALNDTDRQSVETYLNNRWIVQLANPSVVASIGAVPASTTTGAATALPAAVAGVGAVPAPTAFSTAAGTALPAVVVGVSAVPSPAAKGNGNGVPSVVAGVGSVPAATGKGIATVSPARVIGIGAVPAATAFGVVNGLGLPATVTAIGRVPFPTTEGEGTGGGGGSPNGSQDFWSAVLAS
jgi:hypothetical protein